MSKIQINFYDEVVNTICPANIDTFKSVLCRKFSLDRADVDEFLIYYFHEGDKIMVSNSEDYMKAIANMKETENKKGMTIFIEISEKSRLFKKEVEGSGHVEKEEVKVPEEIKREESEIKKDLKNDFEEIKIEEATEINSQFKTEINLEGNKKIDSDLDELRASLEKIALDSLNKQFEAVKKDLVNKATEEALSKLSQNKEPEPKRVVHSGFSCDGCGLTPIVGSRYHCTQCFNFDLCEGCEAKDSHPGDHPLLKFKNQAEFHHRHKFSYHPWKNIVEPFCRPFKNKFKFHHQIKLLREKFDLRNFSDEQLIEALKKSNRNVEEAIAFLF